MSNNPQKKCECHCHSKPLPNGAVCRCIKNCEHCHPENFPTQPDAESWEEEFSGKFVHPTRSRVFSGKILCFSEGEEIKSFIHQVEEKAYQRGKTALAEMWTNAKVAEARQSVYSEIMEMVEGMRMILNPNKEIPREDRSRAIAYNIAIKEVLSKLKEKLQ